MESEESKLESFETYITKNLDGRLDNETIKDLGDDAEFILRRIKEEQKIKEEIEKRDNEINRLKREIMK